MFGKQVAAVDHILLRDADEHVFQRDQFLSLLPVQLKILLAATHFRPK